MSNLADEIRDEIDEHRENATAHGASTWTADALRAVMNLHIQRPGYPTCQACPQTPYPCPTARTIAEEMGMAVEAEAKCETCNGTGVSAYYRMPEHRLGAGPCPDCSAGTEVPR